MVSKYGLTWKLFFRVDGHNKIIYHSLIDSYIFSQRKSFFWKTLQSVDQESVCYDSGILSPFLPNAYILTAYN